MNRLIVAVALIVFPVFAFASIGAVLDGGTGGAVGAFFGSFVGSIVRDAVWLRKHKTECLARNHFTPKEEV